MNDGQINEISNPSELPAQTLYQSIEEPVVKAAIHVPNDCVGVIIKLCTEKRGIQEDIEYITEDRVYLRYILPLNEIIFDFYDKLKGLTRGYASMDYEMAGYQKASLVKVDILINREPVDSLSLICHKDDAFFKGRELAKKLQKIINRQQFDIAIQAAIGAKILARGNCQGPEKKCLWPNVTEVTFPERENFLKNKRPERNA